MYPRTTKHKVAIQVDHKCDNFAALLKNNPMGCPDSVLLEPLLRHTQVNCLLSNKDKEPYKDHLCLFRALAMSEHNKRKFYNKTFLRMLKLKESKFKSKLPFIVRTVSIKT